MFISLVLIGLKTSFGQGTFSPLFTLFVLIVNSFTVFWFIDIYGLRRLRYYIVRRYFFLYQGPLIFIIKFNFELAPQIITLIKLILITRSFIWSPYKGSYVTFSCTLHESFTKREEEGEGRNGIIEKVFI